MRIYNRTYKKKIYKDYYNKIHNIIIYFHTDTPNYPLYNSRVYTQPQMLLKKSL